MMANARSLFDIVESVCSAMRAALSNGDYDTFLALESSFYSNVIKEQNGTN